MLWANLKALRMGRSSMLRGYNGMTVTIFYHQLFVLSCPPELCGIKFGL
jgi:hypothetical protein